jgi:uncharacterized repeat protein (TIGR01451 family)
MNTLQWLYCMRTNTSFAPLCGALLAVWLAPIGTAQEVLDPLAIKAIAEVEFRSTEGGREVVKLVPADRVVPGDRVIYTLEVRNITASALPAPTVIHPIPDHMRYIADSAVGPGAEVSYSVDGGHSFGPAEDLKVPGVGGQLRPAVAADYTHIRWQLKNSLRANSVAFVRFRALVK